MAESSKRTIQVNVRLTTEDLDLIGDAAKALWPGAILTNSGILLGLARIAARDAIGVESAKSPSNGKTSTGSKSSKAAKKTK